MSRAVLILLASLAPSAGAAEVVTVLNAFDTPPAIDRFCGKVRNAYVRAAPEPKREGRGACRVDYLMDHATTKPGEVAAEYARGDFPYAN